MTSDLLDHLDVYAEVILWTGVALKLIVAVVEMPPGSLQQAIGIYGASAIWTVGVMRMPMNTATNWIDDARPRSSR
jgi:hypothetical protein